LHLSIRTWYRTGFYRRELESAIQIDPDSAETLKTRLEWFVLCVFWMCVFAMAVCLPDFKHGIRNRLTFPVNHAARNGYPFPRDFRPYEVSFFQPGETDREERAYGL
jgi:hypothetical protein